MMLATRTVIGSLAVLAVVGMAAIGTTSPLGYRHPQPVAPEIERAVKMTDAIARHIVDARGEPYAAVGKFLGTMACTAAIVVDPRIIITAGHCVTERDGSIRNSNLSFRLGYQDGSDLGRFEASVWAMGSKQSFKRQSVHEASQDWVLLVLDRAPEGVQPLLLSDHTFEALKSYGRQLLMPSYSSDIGDAEVLSVDPACSIRDLVWDVLVHDCGARSGSSGAPILTREGLQYAVVGIHTGSMFASNEDGRVAKFVGYRAIGSWMFTEPLLALSRQLAVEAPQLEDSPTY